MQMTSLDSILLLVFPSGRVYVSPQIFLQCDETVLDTFQICWGKMGYLKSWQDIAGDLSLGKAGPVLAGKAREGEAGKVTLRQCSNALSRWTLWESTPASQYCSLHVSRRNFSVGKKKKKKENKTKSKQTSKGIPGSQLVPLAAQSCGGRES